MERCLIQKMDHTAIKVNNLSEAISWYTKNLGATIDYSDDTWAMLNIADTKLALALHHPSHIAFTVDDISYLGPNPKRHRDGSYFRYVNDPEGNTIELIYWTKEKSNDEIRVM